MLIVFLIIVQASDVLQYAWGKLIGKHKIAPVRRPPRPSRVLLAGSPAPRRSAPRSGGSPLTLRQAGLMALVVNLMGFCSGLVSQPYQGDRGVRGLAK